MDNDNYQKLHISFSIKQSVLLKCNGHYFKSLSQNEADKLDSEIFEDNNEVIKLWTTWIYHNPYQIYYFPTSGREHTDFLCSIDLTWGKRDLCKIKSITKEMTFQDLIDYGQNLHWYVPLKRGHIIGIFRVGSEQPIDLNTIIYEDIVIHELNLIYRVKGYNPN